MSGLLRHLALGTFLLAAMGGAPAVGQSVDLGGRIFADYFYNASAPDSVATPGDEEGLHGFRYRRLFLTTDFTLSEDFTGRARLEAKEDTRPFVKDLFLTWTYSGDHSATVGVTPPPVFDIATEFWGYRSLDKTVVDLQGIASSRDFGLRLDGPVTGNGAVRYAVMLGNDSGVQSETNTAKRVYGQLQATPGSFTVVVGSDYAGYADARDYGTRVSAFGGYRADWGRVGVEGYWYRLTFEAEGERTDVGGSLFGIVQLTPKWEFVARIDRSAEFHPGGDRFETFLLGGVSYRPHPNVVFTPNLRVQDLSDRAATTTGRLTLKVQF